MTEEETRLVAAIDNPRLTRCGLTRRDDGVAYVCVSGPRPALIRLADMEAISEFFSTPHVNAISQADSSLLFEVLPP